MFQQSKSNHCVLQGGAETKLRYPCRGVVKSHIATHVPERNERAEMLNQRLAEKTFALVHEHQVTTRLWLDVCCTASQVSHIPTTSEETLTDKSRSATETSKRSLLHTQMRKKALNARLRYVGGSWKRLNVGQRR
jgi:hypothetical protein